MAEASAPQQRRMDTDLAAALWRAEQRGETVASGPKLPDTAEDGYRVQWRGAAQRRAAGDPPVGFKIGLFARTAPQAPSVQERGYGLLYRSALASSPAEVALATRGTVVIEAELAARIGADIAARELTGPRLVSAVDEVAAAIEVVWSRWEPHPPALSAWLADNASAGYAVMGAPTAARPDLLVDVGASITVDGAAAVTGRSPMAGTALEWLADTLKAQGRAVSRGTTVLTGAVAVVTGVEPGAVIRVEIEEIGQAAISLQ